VNNPTPEQIKEARENAGLNRKQAELLIYNSTPWNSYECGKAKMKVATWELFQLKLKLKEVGVTIDPVMETKPTPEQIKQARITAGLTQTQAADMLHKSLRVWQNYELGDRSMDISHWVLFQIKLKYQLNISVSQTLDGVIDMPPTPDEIRKARETAGLTKAEAASMIHRSTRTWEFYEDGNRSMDVSRWRLFQQQINKNKAQ
jgi:DNA-binding XRE family transcriptional regulator